MSVSLKQLTAHRWKSVTGTCVGVLTLSLEEIASRTGLRIESWVRDGIGLERGMLCELPSGRLVLIHQPELGVAKPQGPEIEADAADVARAGLGAVRAEVLSALFLQNPVPREESDPFFRAREIRLRPRTAADR